MPRDPRKYLFDIDQTAKKLAPFVEGKTYQDYLADELLSAAVERQFEIISEALSQLAKIDPSLAQRIPEYQRIIAFRNVLIHGYADVDSRLVWGVVESKLENLVSAVEQLLDTMK